MQLLDVAFIQNLLGLSLLQPLVSWNVWVLVLVLIEALVQDLIVWRLGVLERLVGDLVLSLLEFAALFFA